MFKQILLSNWNLMRFIRLGAGVIIAIQAIQFHDILAGLIGFVFLIQALTNTGCCGSGVCVNNNNLKEKNNLQDVVFEEVK